MHVVSHRIPEVRRRYARRALFAGSAIGLLAMWFFPSVTHAWPADALAASTQNAPGNTETAPAPLPATAVESMPAPGKYYGAWVLLPAVLTIILAIAFRQVVPALSVGVLVAAAMLEWHKQQAWSCMLLITPVTASVEHYLIGAVADASHIKVVLFSLVIGGMVGIIAANGGTGAVVERVSRWAASRRKGQVATWLAGLLVFFDDYANAMIVGPSMRPFCDRLRISRAKLAYLVDSTAAPVASIAFIGTWIGAEVGYIQDGLDQLQTAPDFLAGTSAYSIFLSSIAYRTYPILALFFVLLVALFDRDFGPMQKAERDALAGTATSSDAASTATSEQAERPGGRIWLALAPVLVLVVVTLGLLFLTGWLAVADATPRPRGFALVQKIISAGDSYNAILYGALASFVLALVLSIAGRAQKLGDAMDAALESMSRMLPTIIVLVLAWTLSATMGDLQLGEVARDLLRGADLNVQWLPLLVFVVACVVSFATGSSWGTMGILCPAVVTIAAGLLEDAPTQDALSLFYASVGAVLAGAVFGDHCSPISDTTVLSSLASGCSLEQHVWTQMPYALTVGAVAVLAGDVLGHGFGQAWWVGLLAGGAALVLLLFVLGRRNCARPQPLH